MNNIVIIGAGGFGREVKWLIERINNEHCSRYGTLKWDLCGFVDDNIEPGTKVDGVPVLGNINDLIKAEKSMSVVFALGNPKIREKIFRKIKENHNLLLPNLVDPSVMMSDSITMGEGNVICAGNIFTVNIKIGDCCLINLNSTIGHEAVINSFSVICPGCNISGFVEIGRAVEIGTGSQIIQHKVIGSGSIVGAGSVVVTDIPTDCTAVGCPCKPIKFMK